MAQKKGANKYDHEVVSVQELRRGPWTLEEDSLLIHYIARHGEGRWNLLARCSGLKRTGKSCRLRWLNYLKPDVKRGNLSLEEQFLILELHSKWGNRWSRIAQYLPGRTDNEIKNYWRTRVQKQARQLKIDANSAAFRDTVRYYWMPRLIERMASNGSSSIQSTINQNYTIQASSSSTLGQQLPQHFNNFPSQDYGKIHSRRIFTMQAPLESLDELSLHKGKTHLNDMQRVIRCKPLYSSFFQDYLLDPSSTNSYGTNASSDMFVHGMHNGHNSFEELDLASSSDCIEEGSNLGDELWGLAELVACR